MTRVFDTIYLHAGLPKTGSSHLQDSLHMLSRAGLLTRLAYPDANPALGTGNGSALAAELIFTNAAPTSTTWLEAHVQAIVDACPAGARDLLISSEDLCYADVEKFARLREVLLRHAREVVLVLAVRPLRDWSYSVYLQLVRAHTLASDYDADWLQAHTGDFLYYFRNLDRFGVDARVLCYQGKDLLRRFLALLGEDEALAEQVPDTVANRSLTAAETRVLRALNRVFGDEVLGRLVSAELVARAPDARGARFPAEREADFQAFQARFARELETFPGPVMAAVKPILFDQSGAVEAQGVPAPDTLPQAETETALRTLRNLMLAQADDAAQYRRLREHAATLGTGGDRFDPLHYLLMHPDVLRAGASPREHFERHGRDEGRPGAYAAGDAS